MSDDFDLAVSILDTLQERRTAECSGCNGLGEVIVVGQGLAACRRCGGSGKAPNRRPAP